jgi:flavin-dependent dehydrogenase
MRFGIIGSRLAGSYLGLLLRQAGHEVLLFDNSAGREKPCGGGVTSKALRTIPWFTHRRLPHTTVDTLRLITRHGEKADIGLANPIHIFSRSTLDSALREDAIGAGAHFFPLRASRFAFENHKWSIFAGGGAFEVDFIAGADGAASSVRAAVASRHSASDLSLALGFYLPGIYHQNSLIAAFQEPGFQGYLWSFPRVDHSSVGILRWLPQAGAVDLRERVARFIDEHYAASASVKNFYAATIPCLSAASLRSQRVCGPGWALLGDAAGFADAITGEGIFYALRSAELLARAIKAGRPADYEQAWRRDFGGDLMRAATMRERFFGAGYKGRSTVEQAARLTGRSRTVARLVNALISGSVGYDGFIAGLLRKSPWILRDYLGSGDS